MQSPEAFKAELKQIVDSRHCIHHPLVEAWAAGTLPKEVLGRWAQEHYHFTKDLQAFLATTTWGLKDWLTRISTRQSWIESAAGMHIGMESQMPTMAAKILPALREKYGLTDHELRFFDVHYEADQEHGSRIYDLVGKYATTPEIQEAVKQAVREGTQKRWLYYDGVYVKYVLGYPIDALPA
jgi:pyrroloquinoline-quinone synthase